MLKKILLFILINFNLIFVFVTLEKNYTIINVNVNDNFYNEISEYKSFNSNYLDKYYEQYQKTNNIIYSLNLINHPFFLNSNSKNKSFYFDKKNILVNKNFCLEHNFIPNNLVPVTLPKIIRKNENMLINKIVLVNAKKMFNDANKLNLNLIVYSGYRSFEKQNIIYNTAQDKSYIAIPGTSEHQTGYALDIATIDSGLTDYFLNTKEFLFLKDHAHEYGFILRYPKSKENITQYPSECWHFRYVGIDIATIIYNECLTLEEYIYMYVELNLHQN